MTNVGVKRAATEPQVKRAMLGVFAAFFMGGFIFFNWASRLPLVRDSLDASPGQMGGIILFGSLGSMAMMPFAGAIATRFGIKATLRIAVAINVVGYIGAGAAVSIGSIPLTMAALFVTGIGMGPWDVTMNVAGTVVEQRLGRPVMPYFHAFWSIGTAIGALTGAAAQALKIPLFWHLTGIALVAGLVVAIVAAWMLPVPRTSAAPAGESGPSERKRFGAARAWLEPRTLGIGLIVLATTLAEGSAGDWIALGVVTDLRQLEQVGAIALWVFVVAMTVTRLLGTGLIAKLGRVTMLRLSGGFAAVGLLIYVLAPSLWLALIGIALWGLGAAIGFPVGMSAASDDPLQAASRVSVVSTIGYTAFLAGPPLLGLLANHVGYRNALLAILVPIVIGILIAGVAAPPKKREPAA